MPFDFKKEERTLYQPPRTPGILTVPPMNFLAVRGSGDPNQEGGAYQQAIQLLYGVAFTLKMSEKTGYHIPGAFAYVVPPLEGLWWQPGKTELDLRHKEQLAWISMIRVPDFVDQAAFHWAVEQATAKRKWTFPRWNFSVMRRGFVFSVCMLARMIPNRRPSTKWKPMLRSRGISQTLQYSVSITRSISATQGVLHLKKCARSCVIRCARRNARSKQML